jgi:hypothetical protein
MGSCGAGLSGRPASNCRSSGRVTGQHADRDIECLTGSLDRMWSMCHRAPALSIPSGDRAVMDPTARLGHRPGHAPRAGILEGVPDGLRLPGRNRHQHLLCDTLRRPSLPPALSLKAIEVESTRTINVAQFVPRAEIDDLYIDRPYYIVPDG